MSPQSVITENNLLVLTGNPASPELFAVSPEKQTGSLKEARSQFEKKYILDHLISNDWNITKTAEKLRLERTHLYRKMKLLGIEVEKRTNIV